MTRKNKAKMEAKEERDRQATLRLNPLIIKWEGSWPARRRRKLESLHGDEKDEYLRLHPATFGIVKRAAIKVQAYPWNMPK